MLTFSSGAPNLSSLVFLNQSLSLGSCALYRSMMMVCIIGITAPDEMLLTKKQQSDSPGRITTQGLRGECELHKAGRMACMSTMTAPGMMLIIKMGDTFKWRRA